MDSSDEAVLDLIQLYMLARARRRQATRSKRRFGIHPIRRSRQQYGQFRTLFGQLMADGAEFRKYTRMSIASFEKLLGLISEKLQKRSRREPLSPAERLVVCLRYLATGTSFRAVAINFFLGASTVSTLCHEVCRALVDVLKPAYLRTPTSENEWRDIADDFFGRWNMPNTLGAIDGKHIHIRAPPHSGTMYFNYKKSFSIVLMAVADARCKIIYAQVGDYGSNNDAGIFNESELAKAINPDQGNPLNLPDRAPLPGTSISVPFFFVGDGIFPQSHRLMKPFGARNLTREKRIYNYRLSRARRIIESTFGLMCSRWRVLLKNIEASVANADYIVWACCCLHNYLIEEEGSPAMNDDQRQEYEELAGRLHQAQMRRRNANRSPNSAEAIRNELVRFLNGEGAVDWQEEYINQAPEYDNDIVVDDISDDE